MTLHASDCLAPHLPSVAQAIGLARAGLMPVTGEETVPLHRAARRIAARTIHAPTAMPPFPRAAMDGFAFRSGSYSPLTLVGTARAGHAFGGAVEPHQCVAIATGARLPDGCDTVVKIEDCRQEGESVWLGRPLVPGANVRQRGEDYAEGDVLIHGGSRFSSRHAGLLASAGFDRVTVRRPLRVAVFSCGDEFLDGTLHDSNRPMLMAGLNNCVVSDLGILPSVRGAIEAALAEAAKNHDVIISSAGTSVGDDDYIQAAILNNGGHILVSGVAIRPGKPVTLARIGGALHVALPGNPVAAFVTFQVLGRRLLDHLLGARASDLPSRMVRAGFTHRKKKGMSEYLRVMLKPGTDGVAVAQALPNGSAQLCALAHCDGLLVLADEVTDVEPGQLLPCLMPDGAC